MSETLSWYYHAHRAKRRYAALEENTGSLDHIHPTLVGRLRVKELYSSVTTRWLNLSWIRGLLHELVTGQIPMVIKPPQQLPITHVSRVIEARERELVGTAEEIEKGGRFLLTEFQGRRRCYCGMFTVEKRDRSLRVIFDARPANQLTEKLHGFVLFGVNDLLRAIHLLRKRNRSGKLFFINKDFRHWFYQILTHRNHWNLFVIMLRGRAFASQVLCMGYHRSPGIAQAASWGIILYREEGEDTLGVQEPTEMPPFLYLMQEGEIVGFIFLILDNILVMTDDAALAQKWRDRLKRNAKKFDATFKDMEGQDAIIEVAIMPDNEVYTTFCGIEIGARGWRPQRLEVSEIPAAPMRRRDISSLLGQILWRLRVRGIALAHARHVIAVSRWLAGEGQKGQDERIRAFWNEMLQLPEEHVSALRWGIGMSNDESWSPDQFPVPPRQEISGFPPGVSPRVIWVAVDATPRATAFVEMREIPDEVTLGVVHFEVHFEVPSCRRRPREKNGQQH